MNNLFYNYVCMHYDLWCYAMFMIINFQCSISKQITVTLLDVNQDKNIIHNS